MSNTRNVIADARAARADGKREQPTWLTKETVVGLVIFVGVLLFFLTQTRLPNVLRKFATITNPASGRGRATFSQVVDPGSFPAPMRWVAYGINLWDANAVGMFFAILLAGAAVTAMAPQARLKLLLQKRGAVGAGLGSGLGLPLFMCSACSAPVAIGFYRSGAAVEASLGVIFGSALFNPIGILAIFLFMPLSMGLARVGFGLFAVFFLAPFLARVHERQIPNSTTKSTEEVTSVFAQACSVEQPRPSPTWTDAVKRSFLEWWRQTIDGSLRLIPPMLLAGFIVGAVLQFAPPQRLSDIVGSGLLAIVATAAVGTLIQLPTLFEIPLVLGVLALGLGIGPATALLLTAPSSGAVTFLLTRKELGNRLAAFMLLGTFAGGVAGGLVVNAL
ncbi:MAG: permease [Actinomycetota bacterium]|nr:permease [Actinomycetota bacterium]